MHIGNRIGIVYKKMHGVLFFPPNVIHKQVPIVLDNSMKIKNGTIFYFVILPHLFYQSLLIAYLGSFQLSVNENIKMYVLTHKYFYIFLLTFMESRITRSGCKHLLKSFILIDTVPSKKVIS